MLFVRFTTDAKRDLENAASFNVFEEEQLDGLCGYSVMQHEEPEDVAKAKANWVGQPYAKETEGEYAVFEGELVGQGNECQIFKPQSVDKVSNIHED